MSDKELETKSDELFKDINDSVTELNVADNILLLNDENGNETEFKLLDLR